jgi:hypothetical protein
LGGWLLQPNHVPRHGGLVILRHARRRLVSVSVTKKPTGEWIASQLTDGFLWDEAPRHLIRDRDCAFGPAYIRRIRAMGIRDHPTAPRSPWQNGPRRTAHRIDTSRMSRPPHRVQRGALARRPEGLRLILHRGPDSSLTG